MELMPGRIWRRRASGVCPTHRQQSGGKWEFLGKKKIASLDILLQKENVEFEHELAFSATLLLGQIMLGKQVDKDMHEARKRQVFEVGSRSKVRGPARAG